MVQCVSQSSPRNGTKNKEAKCSGLNFFMRRQICRVDHGASSVVVAIAHLSKRLHAHGLLMHVRRRVLFVSSEDGLKDQYGKPR